MFSVMSKRTAAVTVALAGLTAFTPVVSANAAPAANGYVQVCAYGNYGQSTRHIGAGGCSGYTSIVSGVNAQVFGQVSNAVFYLGSFTTNGRDQTAVTQGTPQTASWYGVSS
jgi:hypothetical protein